MFIESESFTAPAISESELATFETAHGIRFPDSLRNEILRVNGGRFSGKGFRKDGELYGEYVLLGFHGIKTSPDAELPKLYCLQTLMDDYDGIENLPDVVGDPRKVWVFENQTGHDFFALNWSNRPLNEPSVWSINIDGKPEGYEFAATWGAFMALEYFGDSTNSVKYGDGWDGYSILVEHSYSTEYKQDVKSRLGHKGSSLKLQTQSTGNETSISDYVLDAKDASIWLSFNENGYPKLALNGKGLRKTSVKAEGSATWINEESISANDLILSPSLDTLAKAFGVIHSYQ